MNERIKQLILDAGFPKFDKMYVVSDGEELEKFAESIVGECIKICDDARKLTSMVPLKDDEQITAVVCMIKKHFGVEE